MQQLVILVVGPSSCRWWLPPWAHPHSAWGQGGGSGSHGEPAVATGLPQAPPHLTLPTAFWGRQWGLWKPQGAHCRAPPPCPAPASRHSEPVGAGDGDSRGDRGLRSLLCSPPAWQQEGGWLGPPGVNEGTQGAAQAWGLDNGWCKSKETH